MIKRTLITVISFYIPHAMATNYDLAHPVDLTSPKVKIVVYYKEEPTKVVYTAPLPLENERTIEKPDQNIVRIRLEDYRKIFIPVQGDPTSPGYFYNFPLQAAPKDVIKLIGRLSGNIPGMSGINRFFRSFGYGVVLSLPCGFVQTDKWAAVKEGKNPFPHALQIEELHLTQLNQKALVEMGFIPEEQVAKSREDHFVWGGWEPHDHLLEKPKEIPCLLITQTFPKLKRLVLRSNLKLTPQVFKILKEKEIKTRRASLKEKAEGLFAKRFFSVQEMRCIETMLYSSLGTEMLTQLLCLMEKRGRKIEDLRALSAVSWRICKYGGYYYSSDEKQVEILLPILQNILEEPTKIEIMDELHQNGLFVWHNLLGIQVSTQLKTAFPLKNCDLKQFFLRSVHMDTLAILALLKDFVTTRIQNQKYTYTKLIIIFINVLGGYKTDEQLRILRTLLPLINTAKLNSISPADNKPYNVEYLNEKSIFTGLNTCKTIFFKFSAEIFSGFLIYYKTLPSKQVEFLDPLIPGSDYALASKFWNYQKKLRNITSPK